jgi:hypothetical protein
MPRRPANLTQADIARVIRAAKQAGAAGVEVRIGAGGAVIVVHILPTETQAPNLEQLGEIVL